MRRALSFACLLLLVLAQSAPAQPARGTLSWREAVDRLAQEKERAETCVAALKRHAAGDAAFLAEGARLYGEAKAHSDGFIERLLVDLAEDRAPDASPELRAKLDGAVTQRIAFCRHVEPRVPQTAGSKNLVLGALSQGAGDLIAALIEGAVEIWKERNRGDELRRATIATRLEAQKWRRFADIPAGA